jgi:hypothetical protein
MRPRQVLLATLTALLCGCAAQERLGDLQLSAELPATIRVGDTFDLVLTLRNHGEAPLEVQDVDVQRSLLDKLRLAAVEPPRNEPPTELRHYRVYHLDEELPAGGEATVVIAFVAQAEGEVVGDIDVSLDPFTLKTVTLKAVVLPPEEAAPAPDG